MIRKSLLGFLLLSLAYALAVAAWPDLSVSQNQNQDNNIKAEQYLYSDTAARPVTVVGTSLSARLVGDSLPDFYNLALGGMSILDGLALVDRRERKPEMLLLETNLYYLDSPIDFLGPVFNPVNHYLKKYLTAFRSDKQPVALATAAAIGALKRLKNGGKSTDAGKAPKEVPLQQKAFEVQVGVYAKLPEAQRVRRKLRALGAQLEALQKDGVKVAFLEMPVNGELVESPLQRYTQQQFRRAFPPERYTYVPDKVWDFQTTDGLHMSPTEAQTLTRYLRAWYQDNKPKQPSLNNEFQTRFYQNLEKDGGTTLVQL